MPAPFVGTWTATTDPPTVAREYAWRCQRLWAQLGLKAVAEPVHYGVVGPRAELLPLHRVPRGAEMRGVCSVETTARGGLRFRARTCGRRACAWVVHQDAWGTSEYEDRFPSPTAAVAPTPDAEQEPSPAKSPSPAIPMPRPADPFCFGECIPCVFGDDPLRRTVC